MRLRFICTSIAISLASCALPQWPAHAQAGGNLQASEIRIPVSGASLFARVVGNGPPVIVLHGGPDFDHRYFLPDMDRFADAFRLIYYDQRGRGKSTENVKAEDVSLASEMEDIDRVRQYFGLEAPILLGHSWGAVLALEYALRYPSRVSRLILMNPAPVSASDYALLRQYYLEKIGVSMEKQREILSSAAYQAGDPETVSARYRIHFRPAFASTSAYEKLMAAMRAAFISQGSQGILMARAVEELLHRDTWQNPAYDLIPKLSGLRVPTLVIAGDHDFIPLAVAQHIAGGLPNAKLVTIKDCGHFGFIECPGEVRKAVGEFSKQVRR